MAKTKQKKLKLHNVIIEHVTANLRDYIIITLMLIVGIFLGVMFINNSKDNQKEEISTYINNYVTTAKEQGDINTVDSLKTSIRDNIVLAFGLWFAGTTLIGIPIVFGIILFRGFCLGYTISACIYTMGFSKGIAFVFTTIFLQNILYIIYEREEMFINKLNFFNKAKILEFEPQHENSSVNYVCENKSEIVSPETATALKAINFSKQVEERAKKEGTEAVIISAEIESEVAQLDNEEEKKEFLDSLGLSETGLAKIIRAGYKLLGLQTYFTCGPKEVRAWTFIKGSKAPQCAGIIHSDFEKGFIRAETIAFDDFIKFGGEQGCKEAGKVRSEGKEYIVQDGDVLLFLFNV